MDITELLKPGELTAHGLLIAAVVGVLRGWWVPKWYFDQMKTERDEWRSVAKATVRVADHVIP